ncbi:MAG: hypothetical protein M3247_01375 [Thermoproteota archaeon]|nr:hypothetical protein [Thermoproteota archaeon]
MVTRRTRRETIIKKPTGGRMVAKVIGIIILIGAIMNIVVGIFVLVPLLLLGIIGLIIAAPLLYLGRTRKEEITTYIEDEAVEDISTKKTDQDEGRLTQAPYDVEQLSLMHRQNNKTSAKEEREQKIAALLGNDPKRLKNKQERQLATDILDTANMKNSLLIIYSNCSWSASVGGSDFVRQTIEGKGYRTIEVAATPDGIYSHNVQKRDKNGFVNVYVAHKGSILKQGSTTASYGVVGISGTFLSET